MKRFFVTVFALSLLACNNEATTEAPVEAKANVPADMHGFTPGYSASFVMDDAKNTETILALWKDWNTGDLSHGRAHFADSLALFLADGTTMVGQTDTILAGVQAYRSSFKSMVAAVDAVFSTHSTDKNEDWVAIWGNEIMTHGDGKVDSVSIHEIWRLNKDAKVDMMVQFTKKGIVPPPPGN